MDKQLSDLIGIIHFTENVSAKIHGMLDEAEIYRTVMEEFAKSKHYTASVMLLTDDGSKLRIAETSIAPKKLEAGEKAAGVRLKGYKIDLQKSSIYSQVVREREIVQATVSDIIGELFPRPLAYLISKAMGYEKSPSILTTLKRRGKIVGVLAMTSANQAEYFIPSVRNLAQHISAALELADEQAERKRAEEELREYRDQLEELVEERTTELTKANQQLQREVTERTRAEEGQRKALAKALRATHALRESEGKYRTLVESADQSIFTMDQDGVFLFMNTVSAQLLGGQPEDFVGKTMWDVFPQEVADRQFATVRGVIQSGQGCIAEKVTILQGELRCYRTSIQPIRDRSGKVHVALVIATDVTDRKRAEEEIRQRTAQLEALRQVGLEITAELDLDCLLHSIVSQAVELVGGTAGGLYLYRPDLDVLMWVMAVGPHLLPMGALLHRGEGLSGKIWETGKPLIVDDSPQWQGRASVYDGYPSTAVVGVPVHWGEKFLGVLNVLADHPHTFSLADAELLSLFATQSAIAIRNSSLFEGEQEQRELAEALEEAAAVVSSTLDPDQVLNRILEQVSRVVPNDATNIMLIEEDQARVVRWRGYERFGAEEFVRAVVFHIPEVPGLQKMVESGEPMVIPDTATYPGWVRLPVTDWLHSYAAAPIVVRGEVIGFLNVDSATPGFFSQADAVTLRAFAGHAAAAIENARLHEAEQERRHIAETLCQASAVLSSTLELDEVLGLILEQLRQVIPYDSASVQRLQDQRLEIVACQGFEEMDKVVGLVFPLDPKFPNHRVVTTKSPLAIEDVVQDYVHFKDEADTYKSGRIRSWLGVPLMVKGEIIGMIAIDRAEVRPYTTEEVELATTFANQAAITIENARLYEAAQQEITERRRAEEELRKSEQKYRTLIEQSLQGIVIGQCLGAPRLVFANRAMADILGYTVDELTSLSPKETAGLVHPEDRGLFFKRFVDRLQGKAAPPRYEVRGIRKDGALRWLEVSSSRIEYQGQPAVQAAFVDITERKQAEEGQRKALAAKEKALARALRATHALRESEERYKMLVRTSPDAVTATDLEGHTTYVSQRTLELHGFESAEELLGRSAFELIAPEDCEKAATNLQRTLEEGVTRNAEYTLLRKDGTRFIGELSAALIKDAHGKPTAFVAITRDITERKMAERAFERRATQLATVGEIGQQIASILELDELLRQIVDLIEEAFECRYVYVLLLDEDSNELVARAGAGPGRILEGTRIPLEARSINAHVARTGEPLLVHDVAAESLYLLLEEIADTRSELTVPIKVKGQVIGTLDVQSTELYAFDESDLSTLQTLAHQAAIAIENARLYEEAQRRIDELTGLHELSQAFSAMTDVRETYGELTRRMAKLIGCQACTIATYDHRNREMRAQPPGYGAPDELIRSFRYKVNGPIRDAWNFRLQGALLANDVAQIPDFFSRWIQGFDLFNLLIIPMTIERRITGLVYAANKPGGFGGDDSKLLTIFANQAAIIIENARLYEETKRWAEEIGSVYSIGVATTSTLSLDEVLDSVCQQVSRLMKVSSFYIALYDAEKDELHFELTLDEEVTLAKFARKLADGAGLSGWIVQSKQPLLIRDAEKEEFPVGAIVVGMPARSWLGVPLLYMDQVVGVMGVQSYQPNAFDEDDRQLLSTIAAQVAIAIENARLFAETNGRAKDLALLLGTSIAISSSLDLDQILKTVAQQIIASLVATFCRISLLDETGKNLVIRAVYPIREQEAKEDFSRQCPLAMAPWHKRVIETGEPVVLRQDVPELALSDEECKLVLTEGVKSAALIPLIVGGRMLGVISLGEKRSWERSPFTPGKVKLCQSIAAQAAVAIENARLYEELRQSFLQTIAALAAAVDAKDAYTGGHSQRTTELGAAIAQELGLSDQEIELIRYAGLLHDVGKIGISEQILGKPGPLDAEEWEAVRRHPALGADIVERAAALQQLVPVIMHHHERYDGQGYPSRLRGEDIPLKARILAVADAYEAMTSDRAYRPAMSVQQALDTLRQGADKQWDGRVVEVLCEIIQERGDEAQR